MKILVVDDNQTNVNVVVTYLKGRGHDVSYAMSGEEAVEKFSAEPADVVLMDIMMPGMDGYEATKIIKDLAAPRWIPVIFLSALGHDEDVIKGLEEGGDDYLSKPVELKVLGAKINAMQRIADMQVELARTSEELQRYKTEAEWEQETAHALMSRLINTGNVENERVSFWLEPASRFSGDMILASKNKAGQTYILLADSTGHGLTAAMPLLPISQTFHSMAKEGFSIGAIVYTMNRQLKMSMPIERFVALTLVLIDSNNCSIEVWNGANPPVICSDEQGNVVHTFESQHMALGVLDENSFSGATELTICKSATNVIVFSDGLSEATNENGDDFGEDGILTAINKTGRPFDNIVDAVRKHLDGKPAHDDVSLITVDCMKGE